jgi:hypothetical protein
VIVLALLVFLPILIFLLSCCYFE